MKIGLVSVPGRLAAMLLLALSSSVVACAAEPGDDDGEASEDELSGTCALGQSCPASLQLLAGRSYATGRPPANLRSDLEIATDNAGWDRVPRRFAQKTSRALTYSGGRVVLSGNAAGNAEIGIDDFFLVEVLDLQGRRIASGTIKADPAVVKLDGQPVRALEPNPGPARGWATYPGGAIDISPILPKDRAFRLRVSAIDFAGVASATDVFARALPGDATPDVGGRACTTDAQCGGGSAMCFIDRCMRVEDTTQRIHGFQSLDAAFGVDGQLRVAYESYWTNYTSSERRLSFGTWGNAGSAGSSGYGVTWTLDRSRGKDPFLGVVSTGGLSDVIRVGGEAGPALPGSPQRVGSLAVARNAAGKTFLAYRQHDARGASSDCAIYFTSRPANGTWSAAEKVGGCTTWNPGQLAIHVRKDGTAEVLANAGTEHLWRYRRANPIDPWTGTIIHGLNTHGVDFSAVHGADGTTHVIAQSKVAFTNSSRPTYETSYLELGDEGIKRTVALGRFEEQYVAPYPTFDVDAAGNVWAERRPHSSLARPSVVRIDTSGNVVDRSIGEVQTGPWNRAAMAVSATGELAFLHAGDGENVGLRRFIPVR